MQKLLKKGILFLQPLYNIAFKENFLIKFLNQMQKTIFYQDLYPDSYLLLQTRGQQNPVYRHSTYSNITFSLQRGLSQISVSHRFPVRQLMCLNVKQVVCLVSWLSRHKLEDNVHMTDYRYVSLGIEMKNVFVPFPSFKLFWASDPFLKMNCYLRLPQLI